MMDFSTFSRKHPVPHEYGDPPPICRKKRLIAGSDQAKPPDQLALSHGHTHTYESSENRRGNQPTNTTKLSEQTASWADTLNSVKKVLEHLKSKETTEDLLLSDSVNRKFLEFHRNFAEEFCVEEKQHSWAVVEKREEMIMYGPFYPNYNSGEHSEDLIIKQTQEILEAGDISEDWKVFVFTMNSPCLARNTEPCMLKLIHKAFEWWSAYGIKSHIGFMRCWGFKGSKENIFRDINYKQIECINQSVDYESYVEAAEKSAELSTLCETVFCVARQLLESEQENFPSTTTVNTPDWKSYFKSMNSVLESESEEEKKLLTQELNTMLEAAEVLLSGKNESFQAQLERGRAFTLSYTFTSQVCDGRQDDLRREFEQCWREMAQHRYADSVREKLTDGFNQRTVKLFIRDIRKLTDVYLHIGKLQF
ncbi:uncharacterized protein ACNS7B_002847 [Menidia menidia]